MSIEDDIECIYEIRKRAKEIAAEADGLPENPCPTMEERMDLMNFSVEGLAKAVEHYLRGYYPDKYPHRIGSEQRQLDSIVDECKRHFGWWDPEDPVALAILRLVLAQNGLADVIRNECCAAMLKAAIAERLDAIANLPKALEDAMRNGIFGSRPNDTW